MHTWALGAFGCIAGVFSSSFTSALGNCLAIEGLYIC
jgi:hypothetical protein